MEPKTKTHYRKVYKSDHLGCADLEEFIEEKVDLIFTIKEVKQYVGKSDGSKIKGRISVAGKEIDANIAYFVEPIKPLVLNATNAKVLKNMTGSGFVEDWKNLVVALMIDETVKMKGEVVGGVRIRPAVKKLPLLAKGTTAYNNAVKHIAQGGNWENITSRYEVSETIKKDIDNDASKQG